MRTARGPRRRAPRPLATSPGDAGVTEAVPAGLGPDAQPVRLEPDGDATDQMTVLRRQRINAAAVSAGEPQHLAVRRDPAHVGCAAAGDVPRHDLAMGGEVDDGDAARPAVGDVEIFAIATRIETMCITAGL